MRHEELIIAMTSLLTEVKKLIENQNVRDQRYNELLDGGLIFDKEVRKFAKNGGAIYMPSRLVGRRFKVILTPWVDAYEVENIRKKGSINYPAGEMSEKQKAHLDKIHDNLRNNKINDSQKPQNAPAEVVGGGANVRKLLV